MDIDKKTFVRTKYQDMMHNTAIIAIDNETGERNTISTNLSHLGLKLPENAFVVDQCILDNDEDFIRAFAQAYCNMADIKAINFGNNESIILTINDLSKFEMIA